MVILLSYTDTDIDIDTDTDTYTDTDTGNTSNLRRSEYTISFLQKVIQTSIDK